MYLRGCIHRLKITRVVRIISATMCRARRGASWIIYIPLAFIYVKLVHVTFVTHAAAEICLSERKHTGSDLKMTKRSLVSQPPARVLFQISSFMCVFCGTNTLSWCCVASIECTRADALAAAFAEGRDRTGCSKNARASSLTPSTIL
jgi:hypothetical protein